MSTDALKSPDLETLAGVGGVESLELINALSEYIDLMESDAARIPARDANTQRLLRNVSGMRGLITRLQRCPSTQLESLVLRGSAERPSGSPNYSLRSVFESFSLDHGQLDPIANSLLAAVRTVASIAAARGEALPVVELQVRLASGLVRATVRCGGLKSVDVVKVNTLARLLAPAKGAVSVQAGEVPLIVCEIPASLRTLTVIVVRAGGQKYALPVHGVVEALRLDPQRVRMAGTREFLSLRSATLPLVSLAAALGSNDPGTSGNRYVVVVASARNRFGLVVDQLIHHRELTLRSADTTTPGRPELFGSAIDSDGQAIEVIDPRHIRPITARSSAA